MTVFMTTFRKIKPFAASRRQSWLFYLCMIAVAVVSLTAVARAEGPDDILSRDAVLREIGRAHV